MQHRSSGRRRGTSAAAAVAVAALALTACSGSDEVAAGADAPAAAEEVSTLRLGFFPNFTHAPALIGIQEGLFKDALADQEVTVTPTAFNAGPDAVTALFSDSLDITYIGPNPTVNAYVESGGDAVRVISGAASGGAALVVNPEITSAQDLVGATLATPQLGNTQDVALRYWLSEQGLESSVEGGGDVNIAPQSNSEGLAAYSSGQIDGAWVPEPWVASYLAQGATVLVDEKDLWPDGEFVTTNIVVRTEFLEQHPDIVEAFLTGHVQALQLIEDDPKQAQTLVNTALQALTGSAIDPEILEQAWQQVQFTADPLPSTLVMSAEHAVAVGLLEQEGIDSAGGFDALYDLTILNKVLASAGLPEVSS